MRGPRIQDEAQAYSRARHPTMGLYQELKRDQMGGAACCDAQDVVLSQGGTLKELFKYKWVRIAEQSVDLQAARASSQGPSLTHSQFAAGPIVGDAGLDLDFWCELLGALAEEALQTE